MRRSQAKPWFRVLTSAVLVASLLFLIHDTTFIARAEENPQALLDAGISAYKLIEIAKAEEYLRRAADILAQTEGTDPEAKRLNAMVHLYLGRVAAVADHPDTARAEFKEALERDPTLVMVTETDPPKIVQLFDETKLSIQSSQPAGTPVPAVPTVQTPRVVVSEAIPTPSAPPKHKKKKWIWWALGGAAVATAAVFAVGSGSGGSSDDTHTATKSGTITSNEQPSLTVVATKSGHLKATVTWINDQAELKISCYDETELPCMGGIYNQTTNTQSVYMASVTQQTYRIVVSAFTSVPDQYTLTVEYP